ncbi:45763_t:CDS:1, partial [Gigaspora margarita]
KLVHSDLHPGNILHAPEATRRSHTKPSDSYSLGIVMTKILIGRRTFDRIPFSSDPVSNYR